MSKRKKPGVSYMSHVYNFLHICLKIAARLDFVSPRLVFYVVCNTNIVQNTYISTYTAMLRLHYVISQHVALRKIVISCFTDTFV